MGSFSTFCWGFFPICSVEKLFSTVGIKCREELTIKIFSSSVKQWFFRRFGVNFES